MLCYVMLCYVMLCYVMLCYVMLCYVMLCYVMLCYVTLCYVCNTFVHNKGYLSWLKLLLFREYAIQCNKVAIHRHSPTLRSWYFLDNPVQAEFAQVGTEYVCVCVWLNICMCNGAYLQLDLQLTGILSACVIFQHDFSATFLWMHLHFRNEKFGEHFEDVIFI